MKEEYTTGEFATLCKLSKKALFHYDKIDLVKPIRVDEKGYRFYRLYQCDQISTIKLFQELGLSLKEIKEIFHSQDFSLKSTVLHTQKEILAQKIEELAAMKEMLEFLTIRFDHFQTIGTEHLYREAVSEDEYYHVSDKSGEPVSVNYLNYGYQYGVLFKREELPDENEVPKHSHIFQRTTKEESNFRKPKGTYLSMLYLLSNEEIMTCIPSFLQEIDLAETEGPLYHEDYCSEIAGYPDKFVIKLSIKLR
ncbi:MerR family transcriptional regulator [Enterococcus sp. BWM-S5]|uniref:MerR family transcriptional regulator n=1 Tax=Enterococcus larvae TaxID=2794352 RepID=A0ABS4CHJ4_9ENTE|nr:MerR family transcriptional regulator [Enterococcus larvae]MBP1046095.1 MerR family transcriptional regulator [Enterococcus larvae]